MEWLPVFTRPETVQILLDSWKYLRREEGMQVFGYVILENHIHWVAQAPKLDKCVTSFKSYTARQIIDYLQDHRVARLLKHLHHAKKAHKKESNYQFWQEGAHPELIINSEMMREKLNYIHYNPVKRGYVDLPEAWRYSSARNYAGQEGLLDVDMWN